MQFQEVVEAEGHLIDSHIMENIFDKVVEYSGRFEVEEFRIGRTNSEASYLRLKVEAPEDASLQRLLQALHELGCSAVDAGDAVLREVERDRCAPEDFYSTTNHRTYVRNGQRWIEVDKQHFSARYCKRRSEVDCRSGLPDAAFLVGNCEHSWPRHYKLRRTLPRVKLAALSAPLGLMGNTRTARCTWQ